MLAVGVGRTATSHWGSSRRRPQALGEEDEEVVEQNRFPRLSGRVCRFCPLSLSSLDRGQFDLLGLTAYSIAYGISYLGTSGVSLKIKRGYPKTCEHSDGCFAYARTARYFISAQLSL